MTDADQHLRDLVAEGAKRYNQGEFWEAHEAWEDAWLQLRDNDAAQTASFLQGLILATAAFENLDRGKPQGFATQGAKALHRLRQHEGLGEPLGVTNEAAFREAFLTLYLTVQREKIRSIDTLPTPHPKLEIIE